MLQTQLPTFNPPIVPQAPWEWIPYAWGWVIVLALMVTFCAIPVWTWLAFRFFRDIHQIRESLQWIAYAQRKVAESERPAEQAAMLSQFGR